MRIERSEWVIAGTIALSLTMVLQVPYVLGYLTANPGTEYSGLLVNLSDVTYYVAIHLGIQGEWLYRIRFTGEPHAGAFLYTFYLALGHLARVLNMDAVLMWHVSRAVLSFILFLVVYGFISYFIQDPHRRRVAFLLAILGAGFDLFRSSFDALDPASAVPLDLRMPEAHLFFSTFTYPHYSAAIALMLILIWCGLRGLTENVSRFTRVALGVGGALASVGVVVVYPFLVFSTAGILGGYYFYMLARAKRILWREGIFLALLFLPAVPLLWYYQRVLATNEVIRLWNEQVNTLSPSPVHYLLTYGAYLVPAVWNLRRVRFGDVESRPRRALLWIWLIVVAVLLYAPLNAQRRFVEGVQVPLAILATTGLYETVLPQVMETRWFRVLAQAPNYSAGGLRTLLVVIFIGVVSLASVFVYTSAVLTNTIVQPYPFFRSQDELAAMDWLSQNASSEDIVFATYYTGAWLPHRAGTRAFIGQYYETAHFFEKLTETRVFFDGGTTNQTRAELLRAQNISYLFYGSSERETGQFDPSKVPFLQRVYAKEDVAIYRVLVP